MSASSRSLVVMLLRLAAAIAFVSTSLSAHGTLLGRDETGNPVAANDPAAVFEYDTVLNITWLRNWDASGTMTWSAAQAWALSLKVGAFGGWKLPTGIGYDAPGPSNQYLSIWNEEGSTLSGLQVDFVDVVPYFYWADSGCRPCTGGTAWWFFPSFGDQSLYPVESILNAVAVRPGDVLRSVPEPNSLALLLLAVGVMSAVCLRRLAQ